MYIYLDIFRIAAEQNRRVRAVTASSREKKPGAVPGFSMIQSRMRERSGGLDIGGLLALRALHDLEAHLLAFLEGLETLHVDGREVCEQILATFVGRNEAKALRIIEPLDNTSCHPTSPVTLLPTYEHVRKAKRQTAVTPSPLTSAFHSLLPKANILKVPA
jgi:hypothetical protein